MLFCYPNSLSRLAYYATSVVTLLTRLPQPLRTIRVFLRLEAEFPIEVQLNSGLRFDVFERMDLWVIKETCLDKVYFPKGLSPSDNWRVIDIGAAFGDFSACIAAEQSSRKVIALEPNPTSFQRLQSTIEKNSLQNVIAINAAVSSKAGRVTLQQGKTAYAGDGRVSGELEGVEVDSVSLSQILDQHLGYCDFLKIDCEGAEYEILQSLNADELARIHYISLEYHDFEEAKPQETLKEFLEQSGFSVRLVKSPVHAYLGYMYCENQHFKKPATALT